jgi:hypothetical protein
VNSLQYIDEIKGGSTHGIDMTGKLQMWEPNIAVIPFLWVSVKIFSHTISPGSGVLLCLATLLWSWWHRSRHQTMDMDLVVSSAFGLASFLMLMVFGVADDGRYMAPTIVCGTLSLLRTVRGRPYEAENDNINAPTQIQVAFHRVPGDRTGTLQ